MTCMTDDSPRFRSPLARILLRLATWSEARHDRPAEPIPEHLRADLGLDGGIRLERPRPSGRSFDHFG